MKEVAEEGEFEEEKVEWILKRIIVIDFIKFLRVLILEGLKN